MLIRRWDRRELDLSPLGRMKQIEDDLKNFEPLTVMGIRRLIEIC
jgi:hypothetical protein